MAIEATPNKILVLRDDLLKLKQQWNKTTLLKSLFFVAALAAGIAAIILLGVNFNFLAIGIGIILISSYAIYHSYNRYRRSSTILNRAAAAMSLSTT